MSETTTTEDQHHVKIEKFERSLLVDLKPQEKATLADRTAHLLSEIERKKEDKKTAGKQAQAQIDELTAELNRVSGEYREGKKFAPVKCERRFLFRVGNYQEVRTDTGELLAERGLTDRERQLELGGVNTDAKDEGSESKPTDEPELPTQKGRKRGGKKPKAD